MASEREKRVQRMRETGNYLLTPDDLEQIEMESLDRLESLLAKRKAAEAK